jgi:NADPH:quinone reductase-like Zn-dependent oxidoreductase
VLGAYAEYILVSKHMLIHKPAELSHVEASGIPETWLTASQALYAIAEFTPGKSILWHVGASGVSIAGIQLSRGGDASAVYATVRQDSKGEWLKSEVGLDQVFNSDNPSWPEEVLKATDGKGVDVVVDFIGGPALPGNLTVLAQGGRIVNLAALGGTKIPDGTDFLQFLRKRARMEASGLRNRDPVYQGKLRNQLVEHALPRFKDGRYKSYIEKVFPWENVVEAHQLLESNTTKGKIICTINGGGKA